MCTLLMLLPMGASAQLLQSKSSIYLSAFIDRQSLGEADVNAELNPIVASVLVGYWARPGIGLELEAGFGLAEDSIGDLELDFNSELGVNLRLESQTESDYAVYALVGYVRSSYDLVNNGFDSTITLPGGRIAFGLTYLVKPQLRVDVGFTHHDYDGDTRVNSFRFGLRYDLDPRVL